MGLWGLLYPVLSQQLTPRFIQDTGKRQQLAGPTLAVSHEIQLKLDLPTVDACLYPE
jgi:hypothetical protein